MLAISGPGARHRRQFLGLVTVLALVLSGLVLAAGPAAGSGAPSIQSDQADYVPGALVNLNGENWQPGESVHITVNDDQGRTWERNVDVVADDAGTISDAFNLPDWFVAVYRVTATGSLSAVATSYFTDGNLKFKVLAVDTNITYTVTTFTNATCSGAGSTPTSKNPPNGTLALGAGDSARIDAPATATPGTRFFTGWALEGGVPTTISGTDGRSICVVGDNASRDVTATYVAGTSTATAVASSANPSSYGDAVTYTATVTASPTNPSVGTVTFKDGAAVLCSNVAMAGNQAGCTTPGLAAGTLSVGPHSITATYNPAGTFLTSTSATLTQQVTKRTLTGSFTAPNKAYNGNTTATIATPSVLGGVVPGDVVGLTGGTATFNNASVGSGKLVTGTGFSLTGADAAAKYLLASTTLTTTAEITSRGVTVGFTAGNKVYNGDTNATITGRSVTGFVAGETVTVSGGTATFSDKHVGNFKAVTASAFVLGGADASNYSVTGVTTTSANITPKPITGDFTADNKVYDGDNSASVLTRTLAGVVSGDVVSLTGGTATFDNRNAGTGKTVTLTGAGLAGADEGNYTLTSVGTSTANITSYGLTVDFTAANKVYDGGSGATITGRSLTGVLPGDTVTVSGGAASFNNRNVADGKPVTATGFSLGGADGSNYSVTSVTPTTADVTPLSITGSFTAANKVYDGDDSASVLTRSLNGDVAGDAVSLSGGTATFGNKNVGDGKAVTLAGASLAGDDKDNYTLASVNTTTADVTPLSITGSFTAANKVYDGNTSASVLTRSLNGDVAGDAVSLAGGTATFGNKNVGDDKTVTLAGASLAGGDQGNYTLASVDTTTADITRLGVTVGFTAGDKPYDGNADAAVTGRSLTGVLTGDTVTVSDGTAVFNDEDAGIDKPVTATGFSLGGADGGNYSITGVTPTTANIDPKSITGSFTAGGKTYDGDIVAAVTGRSLNGVVGGDEVTLTGGSATFANKNAGTGKTVTLTGAGLEGDDQANYTLDSVDTTTADIGPKSITGSFTAANKTYDGNDSASVLTRSLNGVIGLDDVSLAGGTAAFTNRSARTGKTVTLTGATLAGTQQGNYALTSVATTTADINRLEITGNFTAANKTFDGDRSAVVTGRTLNGVISPDDVDLVGGTASFGTRAAGQDKVVTLDGAALEGADQGNYTLLSVATTTADIARLGITGNFTAANKTFDGDRSAVVTDRTLNGVIAPDVVSLDGGTASFDTRAAGQNKSVTLADASLAGADRNNYTLLSVGQTTADIDRLGISGSFTAGNKVYDGNDSASVLTRTLNGVISPDDVDLVGGTATFGNRSVGDDKTVTLTGATLDGADMGNYSLTSVGTTTANISRLGVTVGFTAGNKTYDGNADAAITGRSLTGVLTGDTVTVSDGTAAFDDESAGTGKQVTATGFSLGGTDGDNYSVTSVTPTTANIDPKSITGSFTAATKTYDGDIVAAVTSRSLHGLVGLDDVRLTGGSATFADKNAGTGKTVTLTGAGLEGDDKDNYSLTSVATTTANIDAKSVTGSFTAANKVYDGTIAAAVAGRSLNGVVGLDDVTLAGGSATFADKNVGTAKTVTLAGAGLDGTEKDNYTLASVGRTTADVSSRDLVISAADKSKVYGEGNPEFTGSIDGVQNGEPITLSFTSVADATSGAGSYAIVPHANGTAAVLANYTVLATDGTLSVTPAPLTLTAYPQTKVYATVNPALTFGVHGLVNGDTKVSALTGMPVLTTTAVTGSPVGGYPITLTGGTSTNYALTREDSTLTVTKAALTLKADPKTRILGAANPLLTFSVEGLVNGDTAAAALTGNPVLTTTAVTSSPVNTYPITLTGGTSANYELTRQGSTLTVVFGWAGFLQPINDTAHQTGLQESKFKLGQTIPVKFVLSNASGAVVQQSGSPTFSRSAYRGACDATAAPDSLPTVTPDSGASFAWSSSQYHYNWSTKGMTTSGEYRIFANLADGTSRWTDICLTK